MAIFFIILFIVKGNINTLSFIRLEGLFDGTAELIWATGVLVSAPDAVEPTEDLVGLHATHQRSDALQVAVATTCENDIGQRAAVIDFHFDELAARALCLVDMALGHYSSGFMLV